MKTTKLLLVLTLLFMVGLVSAQYIQVTFKDQSPAPNVTRTLVMNRAAELGFSYVNNQPIANRWVVQLYTDGGDGIISPLDPVTKLPTGDDFIAVTNAATTQGVNFLTNTLWTMYSIRFYDPGTTGNTFKGDNVYLRIFDATTIDAAIKVLTFTGLYTVPFATATCDVATTGLGWAPWANIGVEPETFDLTIESNYGPASILKGGVDTTFDTPHTFTGITADIAGTYTVEMPFVVWDAPYVYDGLADATHRFMGVMTPDPAMTPVPADMASWTIPYDQAPAAQMLSWMPPANGPVPTGYKVWWNGAEVADVTAAPWQWTTTDLIPPAAAGTYDYTWKVVPYITDPAKGTTRSLKPVATRSSMASDKGESTAAVDWHFQIVRDPEIPTGIVVDEDGNVTGPATIVDGGTIPPELMGPDTGIPAVLYTLTATGDDVPVRVYKPAQFVGDWYCWIKAGAMLYAGGNPIPAATLYWDFTAVDFPAKGDVTVVVNDNMTLPVELSSFTATLTATYFVKLTWVSQSETGLLGYRVYRNSSNDQANAVMITPTMVPATNTSTTQTYSITDNEVSIGNTYWYWLESVDYGTSQFHGPVSVIVEGEVPPVVPTTTTMRNAYPNPFKVDGRTTIVVDVKNGDAGNVTIYNILGQAVKTYPVTPGTHNITWNGRDSRGNVCGSGIYFYKLSTPSTNQTKKMVIVK
jgi:hypothetical protein